MGCGERQRQTDRLTEVGTETDRQADMQTETETGGEAVSQQRHEAEGSEAERGEGVGVELTVMSEPYQLCVTYFCICTCSAQLIMFHVERLWKYAH